MLTPEIIASDTAVIACDHCKQVKPWSQIFTLYPPPATEALTESESDDAPASSPDLEVESWELCLDCAPLVLDRLVAQIKNSAG